jgi:hypothetical protein
VTIIFPVTKADDHRTTNKRGSVILTRKNTSQPKRK